MAVVRAKENMYKLTGINNNSYSKLRKLLAASNKISFLLSESSFFLQRKVSGWANDSFVLAASKDLVTSSLPILLS